MNSIVEFLETTPIAFTQELTAAGIHPRDIIAAAEAGQAVRPFYGLIVRPDVYADPDFDDAFACRKTGGIIGRLSAAQRHGLCQALPQQLEILAKATVSRPPADSGIRLFRSRDKAHALPEAIAGVSKRHFHGFEIRITTPARTVVDLYRIQPAAIRQHAVAALAEYIERDEPLDELFGYANLFGLWDVIRPEVEALNEARSRGMMP